MRLCPPYVELRETGRAVGWVEPQAKPIKALRRRGPTVGFACAQPTLRGLAERPSVLQLLLQGRAFAHLGTRLVLLNVGFVVDRGLYHHLFRNRLLPQVSRGDLDGEAADDEAVEFPGGEHLVGLDELDR